MSAREAPPCGVKPADAFVTDPREMRPAYDAVVIGSGYGGATAAAELSANHSVAVLEQGRHWRAGDFPESLGETLGAVVSPVNPLGLLEFNGVFDRRSDVDVLHARGMGGGSLINGGVTKLADPRVYSPEHGFPEGIYPQLEAGFRRFRNLLDPQPWPRFLPEPGPVAALHQVATRANAHFTYEPTLTRREDGPNKAGVHQHACNGCGNCITGCNSSAKGSLDGSLLAIARRQGAQLFERMEVRNIRRDEDGAYTVQFVRRSGPNGLFARPGEVRARSVLLGAGTLGTNALLHRVKRDADSHLHVTDALGEGFSGQADTLGLLLNGDVQNAPFGIAGSKPGVPTGGPGNEVAAGITRLGYDGIRQENAQSSTVPVAFTGVFKAGTVALSAWEALKARSPQRFAQAFREPWNRSMILLGVGAEAGTGRVERRRTGSMRVRWPNYFDDPGVKSTIAFSRQLAEAAGGDYVPLKARKAAVTTHPLGGALLGRVVSDEGELLDARTPGAVHPGFFVVDGSLLPSAVGVNPSGTIVGMASIVAERAKRFLGEQP